MNLTAEQFTEYTNAHGSVIALFAHHPERVVILPGSAALAWRRANLMEQDRVAIVLGCYTAGNFDLLVEDAAWAKTRAAQLPKLAA